MKMVVAVHYIHSYVLEMLGEAGTWGLANVPDGVNKEGEKQVLGLKNIQLGMQRASQIAISGHFDTHALVGWVFSIIVGSLFVQVAAVDRNDRNVAELAYPGWEEPPGKHRIKSRSQDIRIHSSSSILQIYLDSLNIRRCIWSLEGFRLVTV